MFLDNSTRSLFVDQSLSTQHIWTERLYDGFSSDHILACLLNADPVWLESVLHDLFCKGSSDRMLSLVCPAALHDQADPRSFQVLFPAP